MARRKRKRDSNAGMVFAAFIGLLFVGIGVFMGGWAVKDAVVHSQVSRWREVPCTILEAELITHSDDDGTGYRATARYSYIVDGKRYKGTRVTIYSEADGIGSFQQDTHERLQRHQESGEPFPGFVNPEDHSDSILVRDYRWGLLVPKAIFFLAFTGMGTVATVYSIRAIR